MSLKYSDFVDYSKLDLLKRKALDLFEPTLSFPERLNIKIIPETLGQTAVGFDFSGIGDTDFILVHNVEGLGTKNKVAEEMYSEAFDQKRKIANQMDIELFQSLGQDTASTSVNDCLSVGEDVFSYSVMITCGNSNYFKDEEKIHHLLMGYHYAAVLGGFAIPQGETTELKDIVYPDTLNLAGSSVGIIKPKSRLTTGSRIQEGDVIYGAESSGIHSNGLTKARKIAEKLPDRYFTSLGDKKNLGEELLTPTRIYSRAIIPMFEQGIDIHFLQPITGHGWQKIARAKGPFDYVIEKVPEPSLIFKKLIEFGSQHGFDVSDKENYRTWNMGIGYVIIVPENESKRTEEVARNFPLKIHKLGKVAKGERRVIMSFEENGKNVVYNYE